MLSDNECCIFFFFMIRTMELRTYQHFLIYQITMTNLTCARGVFPSLLHTVSYANESVLHDKD